MTLRLAGRIALPVFLKNLLTYEHVNAIIISDQGGVRSRKEDEKNDKGWKDDKAGADAGKTSGETGKSRDGWGP